MQKRFLIEDSIYEKKSHTNILPLISGEIIEIIERISCEYKIAYTNYEVPWNIKEISLLEEFNNWGEVVNFVTSTIVSAGKKSGYFKDEYEFEFLLKNFLLRNSHTLNDYIKKIRLKIYAIAVDIIIENNLDTELLELFLNNFISTPDELNCFAQQNSIISSRMGRDPDARLFNWSDESTNKLFKEFGFRKSIKTVNRGFMLPSTISKRSGEIVSFESDKISKAIYKAFSSLYTNDKIPESDIDKVTSYVLEQLKDAETTSVEKVQDLVEEGLVNFNLPKVAKAYILWRSQRTQARSNRLPPMDKSILSDYILISKYAKYVKEKQRREIFSETVSRVEQMHIRRYPHIEKIISDAFNLVQDKKVLPSMRSMQFGGQAIESLEERIYNCSFSPVNRIEFFKQAFFLLLCGCGVGFSVQKHHVDNLPPLKTINKKKVKHHIVGDTIQGWGDALDELLQSYFITGEYVEFSYFLIRDKGVQLKTSGGKAPGHIDLKENLEKIRALLDAAQGRKLKPIECMDIVCLSSEAVLAGGVRRSATLCLFSVDDDEMMNAKTGDWWEKTPWRARSNNSAALLRKSVTFEQYQKLFDATKQWGEPGFFFTDDLEYGTNPCSEILFKPYLIVTGSDKEYLKKHGIEANIGDKLYGFSFCNLTEINMSVCRTEEEFYKSVEAATIIGTLQAGYTNFPYLGPVTELITRRDALLGVSMTGMMDSPDIAFNPEIQRKGAELAIAVNKKIANLIGVRDSARITCVKPSGTASLALGCVGSGIHPHHAKRYFRRVQQNPLESVYKYFKSINPHMCESISETMDIITFCIEPPENAIINSDLSAIEFLEKVFLTQNNWVKYGVGRDEDAPGLCHNVSNTIIVKENEWEDVKHYLWDRKNFFTGVSMLGHYGDKQYKNAPRESITTYLDEEKWNYLVSNYKHVDYSLMFEEEDNTNFQGEAACAGGACEV